MHMETTVSLLDLLQGGYLLPAVIVVVGVAGYFAANSLFSKAIAAIRSSIRGASIPLELMTGPLRLLFALIALAVLLHSIPLSAVVKDVLRHILLIVAIIAIAWFVMRLFSVFEQFVLQRYAPKVRENESARKISTHVSLARKILNVLLVLLAVSSVLMTFDTVRQIGLSILASAGIAGVILGFAAQKSLATLISGIQIAITQPISIDDVVVVENEWGRIEEITLTYVVVQLWISAVLLYPLPGLLIVRFRTGRVLRPSCLVRCFSIRIIPSIPKRSVMSWRGLWLQPRSGTAE